MRLLRVSADGSLSLTTSIGNEPPKYAILSHTWEADDQEVTLQDIRHNEGKDKAGYRKIGFVLNQVRKDCIEYFWIDSCCIDRTSSAELTEAIISMYRWYKHSTKCYVYLSDISSHNSRPAVQEAPHDVAIGSSRWFTRAWTLQELLAPRIVEFFTQDGCFIGDKVSLETQIHDTTGIPIKALQGVDLSQFTVSERMSWVASRDTTIEEDAAYCLLGIFDISMPALYGEGKKHAFRRLWHEIVMRGAPGLHGRHGLDATNISVAEKGEVCLSHLCGVDQTRFISQSLRQSKGACAWIWRNGEFVSWHEAATSSTLWIKAKAGGGKTTLTAHIYHLLLREPTSPGFETTDCVVLTFFFREPNQAGENVALTAISTLVLQFVRQIPQLLPILVERHELLSAKGSFEWSVDSLLNLLTEMLQHVSHVAQIYIILDAIDECESKSRELILEWIKEIADEGSYLLKSASSGPLLKVLITSRQDGETAGYDSTCRTLNIQDSDTAHDIQLLIHKRMDEIARQRCLDPDVTKGIIDFLESNAHGMFLWIVLVLKELERRDERLSDEVIASRLSATPVTLRDTYEAILRQTPATRKEDMWRIFRWLLFATRSLTLQELEKGLCLELGISRWHGFAGDLIFLCGPLLRFDGLHGEVEFVHQTAKKFLETFSQQTSASDAPSVSLTPCTAHDKMAIACLQFMLDSKEFSELSYRYMQGNTRPAYVNYLKRFLAENPFCSYAADSWHLHLRSQDMPSPAILQMTCEFLSRSESRDAIMILKCYIRHSGHLGAPVGQSELHIASFFDIPWLVEWYILHSTISIDAVSGMNDTPLIWASEMGSTRCARLLLEAGADPNAFEADGWSALHWAARNGRTEVAQLLLEYGAQINHRDEKGYTPLDWAIDRKHIQTIATLESWKLKDEHSDESLKVSSDEPMDDHRSVSESRDFKIDLERRSHEILGIQSPSWANLEPEI